MTVTKRGAKKTRKETAPKKRKADADASDTPQSKKKKVASATGSSFSFREGAIQVLRDAGGPLSAKEIINRMLQAGFQTSGKTPDRTVAARMYTEMKQKGKQSAFCMVGKGLFSLTELVGTKGLEDTAGDTTDESPPARAKRTTKKTRVPEDEEDDEDDEATEDEDEEELQSKKASTSQTPSTTPTNSSTTTPSHSSPSTTTTATAKQSTPLSKPVSRSEDTPYNDEYGYNYLRYFLEISKRQERQDHSPEDECFVCKTGGDLCCCDFPQCSKVYHLHCLDMKKIPTGKWYCPAHVCVVCNAHKKTPTSTTNPVTYNCATCINAYCEEHMPKENTKQIRKELIICPRCMPYFEKEIDTE